MAFVLSEDPVNSFHLQGDWTTLITSWTICNAMSMEVFDINLSKMRILQLRRLHPIPKHTPWICSPLVEYAATSGPPHENQSVSEKHVVQHDPSQPHDSNPDCPVFDKHREPSSIELFYDSSFVANLTTCTNDHEISARRWWSRWTCHSPRRRRWIASQTLRGRRGGSPRSGWAGRRRVWTMEFLAIQASQLGGGDMATDIER